MGTLLPLGEVHAADAELHATLARWRDQHAEAFFTRFPVSERDTARWLRRQVIDANGRMLFLVLDDRGRTIGHMGLANALNPRAEVEIDNVLRGVQAPPGLMGVALGTLASWVRITIGARAVSVRVLQDNHRAVRFYRRTGFVDDSVQALRRVTEGNRVVLTPVQPGDPLAADAHSLRMVLSDGHADNGC